MNTENIAIIIPSLEPDDNFIEYIKSVQAIGDFKIIVVDDGSSKIYDSIYTTLEQLGCILLKHGVNCGKGRSIKTALNHILVHMPEIDVIVTADIDGTYLPEDILKVCMHAKENTITLGSRDFNDDNINRSLRDKNQLTSFLLNVLADINMKDTQTGLRAFKRDILPYLITVGGERYQYDFNMIFEKKQIELQEIPITTTKRTSDKKSHFKPFKDTWTIIWTFFLFIMVSLSSTIIDVVLYSIFIPMFIDSFPFFYVSIATFLARVVSDIYNYYFDKTIVFKTNETSNFGRYVILCVVKTIVSAIAVTVLVFIFKDGETVSKLVVDTVIFFLAYKVEKNWVHEKK